jgi:hypothetical protein
MFKPLWLPIDQLAPPDSYIKFDHLLDLLVKDGSGKDVEIEYLAVQRGVVVGTYAFLGLRAGTTLQMRFLLYARFDPQGCSLFLGLLTRMIRRQWK